MFVYIAVINVIIRYSVQSSSSFEYQMPKTVSYASTPGQGVVYNVIARDLLTGTISAYVPMVTYSCDFYAKIDGCDSLGKSTIPTVCTVYVHYVSVLYLFKRSWDNT